MALVVDSWAKVAAIENFEAVAGELLFRRIFEINPGAKAFFAFAKEDSDNDIYQSEMFQTHSRAVITTVDAAVGLLKTNNMDTLVSVLRGLGAKHVAMNLEQAHYDLVGQALLDTLAKAVGDDFTDEVKEAWVGVYGVIVANMMEGARSKKERQQQPAETEKRNAKTEMEDAMVELKRITVEKVTQALLNAENKALADQERIQAEVAAELERVKEFKAKRDAQEAAAKAQEAAEKAQEAATNLESVSEDPVEDEQMDESLVRKDLDESDILYNQRSCAQYVMDKLFVRA
ncbi:symbiotic hemoglobin 1 [Seminavis robusta]|uniref:Symbiotic hemoglobin 1 n=1 Tax=Seminavis robusta TaxID=568900 RepID=A0A9N8DK06_9STRA|nr:symbiotic hemoglobin 1 [Seminavis robusta]|eukprot:Sro164_g073490.1 symbiotic hemoglobin 1 (289) ;mRNA; f:15713-16672